MKFLARHLPAVSACLVVLGMSGAAYAVSTSKWTVTLATGSSGANQAATPEAPIDAFASPVSSTSLSISWSAPASGPTPTSYKVAKATYSSTCGTFGTPATETSPYTFSGLTAGTTYCFEVIGFVGTNWTATSAIFEGTPEPCGTAGTFTLTANTTLSYTLVGGGGGSGGSNSSSGAAGTQIAGTLDNTTSSSVSLSINVGCAGGNGGSGTSYYDYLGGSGSAGGGYAAGGAGGNGYSTSGSAGGGGGGASSLEITSGTPTYVLVAGGGGGGGGANNGSNGSTSTATSSSTSSTAGTAGTSATSSDKEGGGGGGGGAGTGGTGGGDGTSSSGGGGGGGGDSYIATNGTTVDGVAITVTGSAPTDGSNAGTVGSASL